MPFRHEIRVRYGEVDMQRHVFNAHYLAYIDDALDMWMRARLGEDYLRVVDVVLKRVDLTWNGAAALGESLALDLAVERWGTTSFDVRFQGSVGERPVIDALLTYVAVTPGTVEPTPVPEQVRDALSV